MTSLRIGFDFVVSRSGVSKTEPKGTQAWALKQTCPPGLEVSLTVSLGYTDHC